MLWRVAADIASCRWALLVGLSRLTVRVVPHGASAGVAVADAVAEAVAASVARAGSSCWTLVRLGFTASIVTDTDRAIVVLLIVLLVTIAVGIFALGDRCDNQHAAAIVAAAAACAAHGGQRRQFTMVVAGRQRLTMSMGPVVVALSRRGCAEVGDERGSIG